MLELEHKSEALQEADFNGEVDPDNVLNSFEEAFDDFVVDELSDEDEPFEVVRCLRMTGKKA